MHHFLTGLHLFCCCLYAESSLLYKEEALAWVNPLLSFFPMKFPFQVGPILTRMPVDYTFVQWDRKGAGHDSTGGSCCTGRASSGLSQTRMSFVHWVATILYVLFGSWGTEKQGFPLSSTPSLSSYFLSLIIFLISEEKEIRGRRQF